MLLQQPYVGSPQHELRYLGWRSFQSQNCKQLRALCCLRDVGKQVRDWQIIINYRHLQCYISHGLLLSCSKALPDANFHPSYGEDKAGLDLILQYVKGHLDTPINIPLDQWSPNCGPWAECGPLIVILFSAWGTVLLTDTRHSSYQRHYR